MLVPNCNGKKAALICMPHYNKLLLVVVKEGKKKIPLISKCFFSYQETARSVLGLHLTKNSWGFIKMSDYAQLIRVSCAVDNWIGLQERYVI